MSCLTDAEYPEKSAFTMLGQLILDFKEAFKEHSELYTKATKDTDLKYEQLEVYLKKW